MNNSIKNFTSLMDLPKQDLHFLIKRAKELKDMYKKGIPYTPLENKNLALIFDKSSTRTRVSFEAGMAHFGGNTLFLSPRDTQLGRGEPIEDAARVISSMVDIIVIRTHEHNDLVKFCEYSSVPVINGLTNHLHPCQLLADMLTFYELKGDIKGKKVTWIGDTNNMCNSYINASKQFDFELSIACPKNLEPSLYNNEKNIYITDNPIDAAKDSDLVVTDVWVSMGQENEKENQIKVFKELQVNDEVMKSANSDAIFMHCMPAHREEEVTTEVLEGPQSVIWEEAENRLHAKKALIEYLIVKDK